MYKVITKCPVCSGKLKVLKLKCDRCNTTIENEFELSKFDYLNNEQLYFIEIFMKCRGNIKDVERELKISYPTVRAKLDEVIEALGYNVKPDKEQVNEAKNSILDALEKGEITAEEAIRKLKE